jgi:hypothetical protein
MTLDLNIGSLEIDALTSINETELQAAINQKVQQLIDQGKLQAQPASLSPIHLNELNLQTDTGSSAQQIAEQIAMAIAQQFGK